MHILEMTRPVTIRIEAEDDGLPPHQRAPGLQLAAECLFTVMTDDLAGRYAGAEARAEVATRFAQCPPMGVACPGLRVVGVGAESDERHVRTTLTTDQQAG